MEPGPDVDEERRRRRAAVADEFEAARRRGDLGPRPVEWVLGHANEFVQALDGVSGRVIDLGSGAGVPGLLIAVERQDLEVVLVERRRHRADRLELARRRIPLDNAEVRCVDAEAMSRREVESCEAVVARGFGPPLDTLAVGARLARPGGRIVISEPPPDVDRWSDPTEWSRRGLDLVSRGRVVVFRRRARSSFVSRETDEPG